MLKELRESRSLSRKFLAEKVGIDHTTLWRYENGKYALTSMKNETIELMADALDVDKDYILGVSPKFISFCKLFSKTKTYYLGQKSFILTKRFQLEIVFC